MDASDFVLLAIGTVLAVACIALIAASKPYAALTKPLDAKEHPFLALYPLGFMVLDKTNCRFSSKLGQERRRQCEIIYGKKFSEYYLRLNYAQKISAALFILPFAFLLAPLLGGALGVAVGAILIVLAYVRFDAVITDEVERREDEVARDLPDVLSKLTLLVNAGMILSEAWRNVSLTGDSAMYREMRLAVQEMENGVSESQAILDFGNRCMGAEVKKFCSTLVQNISKGNRELAAYLKRQTAASWEEKKHYARRKGESASSKLMIPISLMLMGILIMVVVPLFAGFDF